MSSTALTSSSSTVLKTPNAKPAAPAVLSKPLSTPIQRAGTSSLPTAPSPNSNKVGTDGKWIHPRLNEVIRRRNANNFDKTNFQTIALHVSFFLSSFLIPGFIASLSPSLWSSSAPALAWTLFALRIIFLANTALALRPLFRKPDACEDIPLTPSQRRLLGLPPMSRPATPQEQQQYITPPRFSRSVTPRSPASSLHAEPSDSPFGSFNTPLENNAYGFMSPTTSLYNTNSDSPFAASVHRSPGERARTPYSANRSSPLGTSDFDPFASSTAGIKSAPATLTTPTKSGRASTGLNNKWLYERGRSSPRGSPGISTGRGGYFS